MYIYIYIYIYIYVCIPFAPAPLRGPQEGRSIFGRVTRGAERGLNVGFNGLLRVTGTPLPMCF